MIADLGYQPRPWQVAVHTGLRRFSVLVCHRRAGKTVLAILTLIDAALRTKKQDARYAYVAPLLKQAKEISWTYLKRYALKIPHVTVNESELWILFPNGARIRVHGADNPDSLRGAYLDGCVLDEVADMKPEVWGEIVRPMLADRMGWMLAIGTPKGINLFSEMYYHALQDASWFAGLYTIHDTNALPQAEVDALRESMTENQFRQELLCDFAASVDNQLIGVEQVIAACGKSVDADLYAGSPKILGVDVARYGGDRSVLFPRQGLAAFQPKVFQNISNMDLAAQVAQSIDKWRPDAVFVDAGRGEGVIDRLIQLGHNPIPVDFGGKAMAPTFENRRAEMWWGVAEWLKAGGALPNLPELKADLCAPQYTYANARGKFALESKDDLRKRGLRSPDLADALALTFAMSVAPRDMKRRTPDDFDPYTEPEQRRQRVTVDYDPMGADRI